MPLDHCFVMSQRALISLSCEGYMLTRRRSNNALVLNKVFKIPRVSYQIIATVRQDDWMRG